MAGYIKTFSFLLLWIIACPVLPLFSQVVVWTQQWDSSVNDYGMDIAVDRDFNVYLAAQKSNSPIDDAFIMKYNVSGTLIWTQQYAGTGDDTAECITLDEAGVIYVGGRKNARHFLKKIDPSGNTVWTQSYAGANTIFDIAVDANKSVYVTGEKNNGSNMDYFTVKYDSLANSIWSQQYNATDDGNGDHALGIVVDPDGNVYITGYVYNGLSELWDFFTIKYSPGGSTIWTQVYDSGNGSDGAWSIALDSEKNVYVTGYRANGLNSDYFLVKYDAGGNTVWTQIFDKGVQDQPQAITVDTYDNIYVTGVIHNGIDRDFFTVKYDPSGNTIWTQQYGSGNGDHVANGIAVDHEHNVYVTGYKDRGGPNYDIFTVKYQQPPYTPSLASASFTSKHSIRLSWPDAVNENEYLVYRSTDSNAFTLVGTLPKNTTSFADSQSIDPALKYFYRLETTNAAGRSVPSNIMTARSWFSDTLHNVVVGPNPFKPHEQHQDFVTFYNLTEEFELSVYDMSGNKVASIISVSPDGRFSWHPRNSEGKYLDSGIYICYIKDTNGHEKKLKLMIIR
ncbi:MAG: SBBP repeat-containing protein [Spirochaetes bacterium]|nr:SBBP repeat-containing protein [Spirochaetota bacterium]